MEAREGGGISRRNLLKAAVATAIVADVAQAINPESVGRTLTLEGRKRLDLQSQELKDKIKGDFTSFTSNNKSVQPEINQENIAKALLYMAYLDGGNDVVNTVVQFIKNKGLDVNDQETQAAGRVRTGGVDSSAKIQFNPSVLKDYYTSLPKPKTTSTIFHELFHIVQIAQDQNNLMQLEGKLGLAAAGALGLIQGTRVGTAINEDIRNATKGELTKRRTFIARGLGILTGAIGGISTAYAANFARKHVTPTELKAYVQTEPPITGIPEIDDKDTPGLLTAKLPQDIQRHLFDFKSVA